MPDKGGPLGFGILPSGGKRPREHQVYVAVPRDVFDRITSFLDVFEGDHEKTLLEDLLKSREYESGDILP